VAAGAVVLRPHHPAQTFAGTVILPNYLHIGYSKAASTWLQDLFRREKGVFLLYKSDFFFPLNSSQWKKGLQYYSGFFKEAGEFKIRIESHEHILLPFHHPRLKCACTNLEVVEKMARRIKQQLPEVKIIITIRNQVDILLSRYTQYILQGGRVSASAFLEELVFQADNYLKYMDYRYSRVIKIFYEIFGKDRVLILNQELLKSKPEAFLHSLSAFFQYPFSSTGGKLKRGKNVAPSYWGTRTLRRINRILVKEVQTSYTKTLTRGPYFIWYLLTRAFRVLDHWLIRKKKKRNLFTPEEIERIKKIFAADNRELATMFDFPFSQHGY
jgi:hypothetical protein